MTVLAVFAATDIDGAMTLFDAVAIPLMWLGRLESVPILVLLSRSYWRV